MGPVLLNHDYNLCFGYSASEFNEMCSLGTTMIKQSTSCDQVVQQLSDKWTTCVHIYMYMYISARGLSHLDPSDNSTQVITRPKKTSTHETIWPTWQLDLLWQLDKDNSTQFIIVFVYYFILLFIICYDVILLHFTLANKLHQIK